MQSMVTGLGEQDIADIAAYFSAQTVNADAALSVCDDDSVPDEAALDKMVLAPAQLSPELAAFQAESFPVTALKERLDVELEQWGQVQPEGGDSPRNYTVIWFDS